jgi:hypothetical protein
MPEEDAHRRAVLTGIVVQEVAAVITDERQEQVQRIARSLIATVHGHCTFDLNGTFSLMGVTDAVDLALDRVRQSLAAQAD